MRIRRRVLVGLAAVLLAVAPVLIAAGQQRWIEPSYPYSVCETCHRPPDENFLPVELVPLVPPEVPAGEAFNVSVVVVNPWLHELRKVDAALDLGEAGDRVRFAEAGSTQPLTFQGEQPAGERRRRTFLVRPGLTRVDLTFEGSPGLLDGNRWRVTLHFPRGDPRTFDVPGDDGGFTHRIDWTGADLPPNASGEWVLDVEMRDSQNVSGSHSWSVSGRLEYEVRDVLHRSYLTDPAIRDVPALGHLVVPFDVRAGASRGAYEARFEVQVELYFAHPQGSGGTDSAFVTETAAFDGRVGDTFVPAPEYEPAVQAPVDRSAFMRSWGKVTGFASLLMILPTFVFIGLFGRHNKVAMNRFFGSARHRVVWHAAVSWIIVALAAVHALLFWMEPRYDVLDFDAFRWTTGWAALGLLFGLGVTGVWQVSFTKRLGYKWWRRLHMTLGIAAFVLSIVHTLYDGQDFQWVLAELRPDVPAMVAVLAAG